MVSEITEESLMNHISVLSSDSFEGRGTGTNGEPKAVEYLVNQLKEIGATSGVTDGSFIQPFPLLGPKIVKSSIKITRPKRKSVVGDFKYFDDFVAWPANEGSKVDISNAELVYVGYGIQAPEENLG